MRLRLTEEGRTTPWSTRVPDLARALHRPEVPADGLMQGPPPEAALAPRRKELKLKEKT